MAVPKRKTSAAKRDSRRTHWKAAKPTVVDCPHCHAPRLAHRVCPSCGYYDGRQIVETD